MKVIKSSDYVTIAIDPEGTMKFEAFLDRNFSGWRDRQARSTFDGLSRDWLVGTDDIIRHAIYRKQFVEIYDDSHAMDEDGEVTVTFMKNLICDIDGDLSPVAVWAMDS